MNLEEIKTAVSCLPLEERRQLLAFLEGGLNPRGAKTPETSLRAAEELDAWAESEAGGARFKDGR